MFVNRSTIMHILGEVFTPWLCTGFGFSTAVRGRSCCDLGSFDKFQGFWEVESRHAVLLESKMQDTYVVEVKLGVHLFAFLIDLVLLWVSFLLVETTAMWTNRIPNLLLRDIQWLNCFEVVATCVFEHSFCMAQEPHLLLTGYLL